MSIDIALIGPPGAGKTSIGKALAKSLAMGFQDTDKLIESQLQKSIAEIFIDNGEPYFRQVEEAICLEAVDSFSGVLSLGGGAVLSPAVQRKLSSTGCTIIFLDVSLAVAAPRIGFNRDRPLLLNNPRQQWQSLMDKRRPVYESLATIAFNVEDKSVTAIVSELVQEVGQRAKN